MNRPKLQSELHPDYPKHSTANWTAAFQAFHQAHPEFKDEGDYRYECTSCGDEVDTDHDYCPSCDQRGGEWVLVDEYGERIDEST